MTEPGHDLRTLERLVRLEEHVAVRFKELDKALELARHGIEYRLAGMNEFQKRMDKLEGTFATKDALNSVSKLIYVGLGVVVTIQFIVYVFVAYVR